MLVDKLAVVYEVEVLNDVPPLTTEYQATVPAGLVGAVAVSVTVPVPHLDAEVTTGADGRGLIVAVTDFLTAETQPVVKFLCTVQYLVVELNTEVKYLLIPAIVPACNTFNVKESEYQLIVIPVAAVALKVMVSEPHFEAFVRVVTVAGNAFIVANTAALVDDAQPAFFDSA